MPYWITETLFVTPALLWMCFGLGIPWSLALLPREDWRDRALVSCLALALGPALLTTWMFVLGSWETPLLRADMILAGTVILAALGVGFAWRKRSVSLPPAAPARKDSPDERLLVILIMAALVIRWLGVAYWPFTAYDALWVYGYEGRLYTLTGFIPHSIGYYPQFLPLQYTFMQVMAGGISDHAARAVIPALHLGSVLAAYLLGKRLVNRRTGVYAAAIWALYPHVGEWSRFGDLEIPLTFLFTAAALFFLMAWTGDNHRGRYALIAGLLLGVGMWTKPTMGAFMWGVGLLAVVELIRLRFDWRACWPRLRIVALTGAACIPLGAAWYIRNALLGHNIIDFPTGFWLTQAARSGVEFGWPLLALLLGMLRMPPRLSARNGRLALLGLGLVLVALLPTIIAPRRMEWLEWGALLAGGALLARTLPPLAWERLDTAERAAAVRIAWGLALALPYFVTWFYSYSYHYRLSFAIVPLLILPSAALVAGWARRLSEPSRAGARRLIFRAAWLVVIVCLSLPGVVSALHDPNAGWDWLWRDTLPDDFARYESGNRALMAVVGGLQIYKDTHDEPLKVVAPGVVRLPFFFPTDEIVVNTRPTLLSELGDATYYIYGRPETAGVYQDIPQQRNQVYSALALAMTTTGLDNTVIRRAWAQDDGFFNYTVYELKLLNTRFDPPRVHVPVGEDVVLGGFARYLGYDIGGDYFFPGRKLIMHLYWQALEAAPEDYTIYIHLRDPQGSVWQTWDSKVTRFDDGNYYSTLVWEPGEYITYERVLILDNPDVPPGEDYQIVFGMYNHLTDQRVPVMVNGQPAGDGYAIRETVDILPEAPQ